MSDLSNLFVLPNLSDGSSFFFLHLAISQIGSARLWQLVFSQHGFGPFFVERKLTLTHELCRWLSIDFRQNLRKKHGSGWGLVGRAVASDFRDLRFVSSHFYVTFISLLSTVLNRLK